MHDATYDRSSLDMGDSARAGKVLPGDGRICCKVVVVLLGSSERAAFHPS